jgi:hypothetical protein
MHTSTLLAGIAASIPHTLVSGLVVGAVAFPAKLGFDHLLHHRGASPWELMLFNACLASLFVAITVVILLRWHAHSRTTQVEHVRRLYAASDRIRNELQTLVYATATTVKDSDTIKIMFKATEDIRKELEQMFPRPADLDPDRSATQGSI